MAARDGARGEHTSASRRADARLGTVAAPADTFRGRRAKSESEGQRRCAPAPRCRRVPIPSARRREVDAVHTPTSRRAAAVVVLAGLQAAAALAVAVDAPPHLRARTLHAARLAGPAPRIDGRLDEPAWRGAEVATDFVESRPRPAAVASLVSRARVVVDDDALYVALEYDDPTPGAIRAPLARRDDETTSDWAFVEIDSRHDRHTGFSFGVNPRGVQVDGLWLSDTLYDSAWNAVWSAAAATTARGWSAEFRIPFSQLSFALPPDARAMVWGINFYRFAPGHAESSNWSPRYPALAGVVSNFNEIVIPAPAHVRRLEATPYVAARGGDDDGERAARIGADLSVGLGPGFRLTATLLPDFGQVEADPSQVNLSAFELFQTERRPFFLEGTDLFRFDTGLAFAARDAAFDNEAPFYSRRIGAAPPGDVPAAAEVLERPATTTLLGAAKLVGDSANGWTLGAFAAATDAEQARVRTAEGGRAAVRIAPRATIGVARALKSSRDGDTNVGFFAQRLERSGLDGDLARGLVRDATTLGVDLRQRYADDAYELRAWALGSQVAGSRAAIRGVEEAPRHLFQRPDFDGALDPAATRLRGFAGEARFARVGGSLRWSLGARGVSRGFDVDGTGYQQTSDWLLLSGTWRFERYPDAGRLRLVAVGSDGSGIGWTTRGERRATVVNGYAYVESRSTANLKLGYTRDLEALAIGWLRGGPALLLPSRDTLTASCASSQTSASYATLDLAWAREPGSRSWAVAVNPLLNVRTSDRLQWSVGPTWRTDAIGWQPVGRPVLDGVAHDLVARVVQRTLGLTVRADYILSPRLAVQLYAQPFATAGRYRRYQLLRAARAGNPADRFAPLCPTCIGARDGTIALDLDGNGTLESAVARPDGAERALNASAVVRWEIRAGSFLTVVWNQRRAGSGGDGRRAAAALLRDLGGDAAVDVVLAKLSWRLGS